MTKLSAPYSVTSGAGVHGDAHGIAIHNTDKNEKGQHFANVAFFDENDQIFATRLMQFEQEPTEDSVLKQLNLTPATIQAAINAPVAAEPVPAPAEVKEKKSAKANA